MSRTNITLAAFFVVAFGGMGALFVLGAPKHPRPLAVASTSSSGSVSQAGAPDGARSPLGARRGAPDPAYEEPRGIGMPAGYRETQARNWMRMRLRELMVAEENHYQESNAYTTDQSKLSILRKTGDVAVVTVTFAGPVGWSAVATHPSLPGKSCVLYAGPVTSLPTAPVTMADHTAPLNERDLVCDK